MTTRPHISARKLSRTTHGLLVLAFAGAACSSAWAQTANPASAPDTVKQADSKQSALPATQPGPSSLAASPAGPQAASPADPREQRRQQLISDTAKLYKLAAELKAEVDKSTKDTLSLAAIRKAEEIEKLARKLRGGKTGP